MPMHMRLPKLRGFKNPFRTVYQVVNLDRLSALYPEGGDVTVADLVAKGAVRDGQPVKVLGTGEITVKVNVTADAFSASAKEKIEAAGGSHRRLTRRTRTKGIRVGPIAPTAELPRASLGHRPGYRVSRPGPIRGRPSAPPWPTWRTSAHRLHPRVPTPDLRKKLLFTLHHRDLPAGLARSPRPNVSYNAVAQCIAGAGRRQRLPRPRQPLQRWRAAPAVDLRAGHHAVHHGVDHRAAAHRGHPSLRGPQEGGPGGPDQDDAVHALPHHRPGVLQSTTLITFARNPGSSSATRLPTSSPDHERCRDPASWCSP
jgi:hypothetical protein